MQTSISADPVAGVSGMVPDLGTHQRGDFRSVRSSETVATVRFGSACQYDGTGTDGLPKVKNLATGADPANLAGIAVWHKFLKRAIDGDIAETDGDGFLPDVAFDILREGHLLVYIETNVEIGDEVHIRIDSVDASANPPKYYGSFRASKDTTHTLDISAFATWATAGSSGDVAEVEVNFVNAALGQADS